MRSGFLDLQDYLNHLRDIGELVTVEAQVDPKLEIAEIHRRVISSGGPALLFRNVKGSQFPLVTNLFGTKRRAHDAFGERPFEFVQKVAELITDLLPPTPGLLWRERETILQLSRLGTRKKHNVQVQEITETPGDLSSLPVLTSWPEDGGPFLTLPLIYTEHPKGLGHNLGLYRMQVYDQVTAGMHWQIGKGGGFHYSAAEEMQTSLPVTAFLGGPPALILAAIAPLPENVPELMLASLIAGNKIETGSSDTGRFLLGNSEFALMGEVQPGITRPEGPFGDHYGYYSLVHDYPVFNLHSIAHRKNPIYPATVVGKPRQEDFFIGDLLQELLAPIFPLVMPAVEKLWAYGETGYHSLAAAVVKQRYRREAMASAFRILGEGQLSLTKFLLVTDSNIDLKDFQATLTHILERTHPERDLYIFSNLSMDSLDYSGPVINEGSKGVWLGLGEPVRKLPTTFRNAAITQGLREVHVFSPGCLVVGGASHSEEPELGSRVAQDSAFEDWPLIVLSDEPRRSVASTVNFLWTTFTRFEPGGDIYAAKTSLERNHICYSPPIVIDARRKESFPKELTCDPSTALQVTKRWKEYFPEGLEMGDSEEAHLTPPNRS